VATVDTANVCSVYQSTHTRKVQVNVTRFLFCFIVKILVCYTEVKEDTSNQEEGKLVRRDNF
jgi:hypothetical protein